MEEAGFLSRKKKKKKDSKKKNSCNHVEEGAAVWTL